MGGFGVEYELQFHNVSALPEPADESTDDDDYRPVKCCSIPPPSTAQGRKLGEAVIMMARHETRSKVVFDVVLRLRPDACLMAGLPFFAFALARTNCASIV